MSALLQVLLASHDGIVPTEAVHRYLESAGKQPNNRSPVETILVQGTHGEMMLFPSYVSLIVKKVEEKCVLYSSVERVEGTKGPRSSVVE